jgi:hypothetical protein
VGQSKEEIARPYQDEASAAGRPSSGPSPHGLAAPVLGPRPLVLLLL